MPTSRINGVDLYWEVDGQEGPPVVLVHGSWGDHRNWGAVVPHLSRSFRVLTYDRRGHSRSERPAGPGSVREDVADLAALLTDQQWPRAHIVGGSFGGSIVLRLAAVRPDLCRSLVVHEPPLFDLLQDLADAQSALAEVRARVAAVVSLLEAGQMTQGARQFVETVAFGPGSWAGLPEHVRQTFVENASTWLDETRDPEALALDLGGLHAFSAPVLLTVGSRSPSVFRPVVNRVADALPAARILTYEGIGHAPQVTHPDRYQQTVQAFIDGVEDEDRRQRL